MNATVEDAGYEYVNIPVDFIKITHIHIFKRGGM